MQILTSKITITSCYIQRKTKAFSHINSSLDKLPSLFVFTLQQTKKIRKITFQNEGWAFILSLGVRDFACASRRQQRERCSLNTDSASTLCTLVHSLPSSTKQPREMTHSRFYGERESMMINFLFSF